VEHPQLDKYVSVSPLSEGFDPTIWTLLLQPEFSTENVPRPARKGTGVNAGAL